MSDLDISYKRVYDDDIGKKTNDAIKSSIETYIKAGGDFMDINSRELIIKAVSHDKGKVIKMLLEAGANPRAIEETPSHVSWYLGYLRKNDLSLKVSNPRNEIVFQKQEPLVSSSHHLDFIVETIGEKLGATLNQSSMFLYAAGHRENKKLASLKALASEASPTHASDINQALCYAFKYRDIKTIEWLLKNGGSIRYINHYAIFDFEIKRLKNDEFYFFRDSRKHFFENLLHITFDGSWLGGPCDYLKFVQELRALVSDDEFLYLIDFKNDENLIPSAILSDKQRFLNAGLLSYIETERIKINLERAIAKAKSEIPEEPAPTISRKRSLDIL